MDFVALFKDFGPWVMLVGFLVWRDWQRETRMSRRIDLQWDELAKLQRKSNEILRDLTDVLRARPCLADDATVSRPHDLPQVPRVRTESHRAAAVAGLIFVAGLLILAGCDEPAPRPDLPAPPAAAEAADLRTQELAAGIKAAQAAAAGDQLMAEHQTRLAAELGKLRAAADDRARVQAAEIAAMRHAADRAARADAEAVQAAVDRRRAWIIAGVGSALCVAAGGLGAWFGLARIAIPAAIAGLLACATLCAFAEATRAAWLAPVAIGALLLAVVAWLLISRRDQALAATASLADTIEQGWRPAAAKAAAKAAQVRAGVHALIKTRPRPAAPTGSDHA